MVITVTKVTLGPSYPILWKREDPFKNIGFPALPLNWKEEAEDLDSIPIGYEDLEGVFDTPCSLEPRLTVRLLIIKDGKAYRLVRIP